MIRDGVRIAIIGPPNAGKSSLINSLAKRPAAIVSPIAGTTRDIVEVRLDLNGVSCIISDTAGLREVTSDPIEQEGIKRARTAFREAQVRLFVCDVSSTTSLTEADFMLKVPCRPQTAPPLMFAFVYLLQHSSHTAYSPHALALFAEIAGRG